jgi:hypothetical protein
MVAAAIVAVVQVGVISSPAQAASSGFAYQANAYGSTVSINDNLISGTSAFATIGCTTEPGAHSENNTASVNLGATGSIGVTVDEVESFLDGSLARVTATSEVATIKLLNGMITADALTLKSETQGLPFANSGSVEFVNLRIGGSAITSTPAPNTKISLGGFGYVVLNEQSSWVGSTGASMSVNALHVVITQQNVLGIKISTNAIIGHAQTSLSGPVAGVMDGSAYGTTSTTGDIVKSGRTAYQSLGCTGTGGKPKTNSLLSVNIPGLTTGTVSSVVSGQVKPTESLADVQNTIEAVRLLDGLVTADLIKAKVSGTRANGATTFVDGSQFVNLKVSGHPEITDSVAPNTMIQVPGVGTLWLHKVVKTGTESMEVRMIELIIDVPDAPLPLDTVVRVSVVKLRLFG